MKVKSGGLGSLYAGSYFAIEYIVEDTGNDIDFTNTFVTKLHSFEVVDPCSFYEATWSITTAQCKSATINPQTIDDFPEQVFGEALALTSLSIPAFGDSLNDPTNNPCGPKRLTLSADAPSFLSVTPGADPLLDDTTI